MGPFEIVEYQARGVLSTLLLLLLVDIKDIVMYLTTRLRGKLHHRRIPNTNASYRKRPPTVVARYVWSLPSIYAPVTQNNVLP